jgi:antitoxin component of RelBE/YafQ-DinJ toxin-antitoxin module
MSHNANMTFSTRVDPKLKKLADESAAKVGLEVSDLIRTGLHAVCGEIAATGSLRIASRSTGSRKGKKKGAAK